MRRYLPVHTGLAGMSVATEKFSARERSPANGDGIPLHSGRRPHSDPVGDEMITTPVDAAQPDFEALVEEHQARVAALARRIVGDPQLAQDITQETFLRAYRHRESIDPDRPVWPWLSTITRRLCINAQRKRRFQEVGLEDAPLASPMTATEDVVAVRERQRSVAAAIGRLSPRQRQLLVLRDVEGLDYDEIAAFDASTVNALRCAVARARDAFRDAYTSVERGLAAVFGLPLGAPAARCDPRPWS